MFLVKLYSTWHTSPFEIEDLRFDPNAPESEAAAVLSFYGPHPAILNFSGPRFWWGHEALSHGMYRTKTAKAMFQALGLHEWMHFSHPDLRYRVPLHTHHDSDFVVGVEGRNGVVAVVSNTGGAWWWFKGDIRRRNSFLLHPKVDLYGSRKDWLGFRRYGSFSTAQAPENYRGEIEGGWTSKGLIHFLCKYRAVVCMENTVEPFYFTEKFVNAARAGVVPIYNAHPGLKTGILADAAYIDPADYNFNVERTLEAALGADLKAVQEKNLAWLNSERVKQTASEATWKHAAQIIRSRLVNGSEKLPPVCKSVQFSSPKVL